MNVKRLLNTFAQFNLVHSNGDRLRVPVFKVKAANISVIKSPTEFYNTLKVCLFFSCNHSFNLKFYFDRI